MKCLCWTALLIVTGLIVGCESSELKECKAEVVREAARCRARSDAVALFACDVTESVQTTLCEHRYKN